MSLSKRSSPSPPQSLASTRDIKHRVITCLNKLSDRDTLAVATTELESIARNLTHDSFSPFLTCIHTTDSSEKSPVRKQCVRLLGLLSETHGDALCPFLSKMISTVVRRLRDPDSAVRSACIDSVAAMSSQIRKAPFSTFLKSFIDIILVEQDYNSQIGAALCLAAAIEAAPEPEPAQLSKVLPRLLKLIRSECFKAKPALLSLIGSIVGAAGASSRAALDCLVPCITEFLSSEDWAARKAAAEVLGRVAVAERDLVVETKASCLASLESRRFDKVKVVRETMNRSLELWKEVPGVSEEVLPPSQSKASSKDNNSGGCSPLVSRSSHNVDCENSQSKNSIPTNRSPPSNSSLASSVKKRSPPKNDDRKSNTAMFCKLDSKSDWNIEVACADDRRRKDSGISKSGENEDIKTARPETKRVLFGKICDEKVHKFGGLRAWSRVVPFHENDNSESAVVDSNAIVEAYGNHKDFEDLSLIHKQLVQIENQQSSLLDLLQRFIGSSQSGMNSLETRVNGLEKALDEMSYDFAISTGRISNTDSAGNTCCKLPGAEFLSSKFWRRTEGRYSTSRFSTSGRIQSVNSMPNVPDKDASTDTYKLDNQRFQHQNGGGCVANPFVDIHNDSMGNLEFSKIPKNINQGAERVNVRGAGEILGSSSTTLVNLGSRSSA
ncbi:hypothetical protein L1049_006377 [Liquidambar formosana]|uniref:TORTIFOLIA1/SINE1-2 N-terminal domain-containing protein n=1 Tax=Liquidambar formosana TaxID=63359 RepID=A0AAP0RFE6_LIQFO